LVRNRPELWGFVALVGAIEVALGLLLGYLGYALLTKRGVQVRPFQTGLGYVAIPFGVWIIFETLWLSIGSIGVSVGSIGHQ
jgi:hypothetical protein